MVKILIKVKILMNMDYNNGRRHGNIEENGVHVKQKKKGTISRIEIKKIIPTFFYFFYILD